MRGGNHTMILPDNPISISSGHSDEFVEPPMWWHAGRGQAALAVQSIQDYPAAIQKSRNPIQKLLAHAAILQVSFEPRSAHRHQERKEQRKYRMLRSWTRTAMSSKSLLFQGGELQA